MERHDTPSLPPDPVAKHTPWFRVHTLGRFQIDWFDPDSGQSKPLPVEKLRGQNAATALGLFKALLSCPDRFATRSWLLEQFWPNSRQHTAEERLTDVVSSLRGLLRPEGNTDMLVHFVYATGTSTKKRGAGFRLDAYPQMWCDADAFEWYVKHGMLLDQRGQNSIACWERAYTLAERGVYLPEQIEEDWTRPRRGYLNGLLRDCVQRWTQLLRDAGYVDEAIMRLRTYWLEHLTDEDALRPLLEMLGERERFGEAEECYVKTCMALTEDGQVPDERTAEAIEAVRALKVQRQSISHQRSVPFSLFPNCSEQFQGIMLPQAYSGEYPLKHSRRQVLSGMVTSAYTLLTLSPYLLLSPEKQETYLATLHDAQPLNSVVLDDLKDITRHYWKLSANLSVPLLSSLQGHFQSIFYLLSTSQASCFQQELFSLVSEAAQLLAKTLCDLRDYSLALSYYTFAVKAALEAKNNNLWATALGRTALLLLSTQRPQQALGCLQEIRNVPQSLKIRSWCAAIEAEAYAYLDNSTFCGYALEKAKAASKECFLEADPYATGFTASRLASYEGSCYLRLNQPEKALPILHQAINGVEPLSVRSHSRLLTYEGMAYMLLGNTQQACNRLSQALDLTLQTQSLDIFHQIQLLSSKLAMGGGTPDIKNLHVRIHEAQRAITCTGDLYE